MRLMSVDLTLEDLRQMAIKFAENLDLQITNVENRTPSRTPSRGKFKGRVKHDLHFLLRPKDGSNRFRKCSNRGTWKKPVFAKQAYVCWIGYIEFAKELLNWCREGENDRVHIELFVGGKRYDTMGKLITYIEESYEEYYGTNHEPSNVAPFNQFQGQQRMCMCAHGLIEGQKERCDHI